MKDEVAQLEKQKKELELKKAKDPVKDGKRSRPAQIKPDDGSANNDKVITPAIVSPKNQEK